MWRWLKGSALFCFVLLWELLFNIRANIHTAQESAVFVSICPKGSVVVCDVLSLLLSQWISDVMVWQEKGSMFTPFQVCHEKILWSLLCFISSPPPHSQTRHTHSYSPLCISYSHQSSHSSSLPLLPLFSHSVTNVYFFLTHFYFLSLSVSD